MPIIKIEDFKIDKVTWKYENGGQGSISYISWRNLEEVMGLALYNEFEKWLRGQTTLPQGAYPWDVERFLNGLPVVD